jgi:putative ABC transport system ATP-binding protein
MEIIISTKDLEFQSFIKYPDLAIQKGDIVFISGPSGCGKSTLLRLFNATHSPSQGYVYFKEDDISLTDTISLRRNIILAGQNVYLFNGTILDNFQIYHQYSESTLPSEEELLNYLRLCSIPFPLATLCDKMSGGEKQRVFLSIALSLRPKVLMLDEPTSALDEHTANIVMANIIGFCKENHITLLVVSHDKLLQEKYAQTVIRLEGRS